MRIRALHLLAFGTFRNTTLRFDNDGGLEVVYGPNEAGKSTTRRAVLALLFGVPERTRDGHTVDEVRVGATLDDDRGRTIEIVRRKGRKNTLLDASGAALDEHVVAGLLGGIGASAYETAYGLDHETLRKGGAALKIGGGELGETLFSAATGLTGLHGVLVDLRNEANAIFVPSGKKPPLNAAQRAFFDARKLAAQLATSADKWLEVVKQIETGSAELEALKRERAEAAVERENVRAALEASRALAQHRAREREIDEQLVAARAELETLAPPAALLSRAQTIADSQARLGSHRKAQEDRPRVAAELDLVLERAARAQRDAPKVDRASGDLPVNAHVHSLAMESAELRQRARQIEADEADAEARLERANARVAQAGAPRDVDALRDVLERVRRDGDLEARLARARDDARRARAAAETQIAALEIDCTLEDLDALALPTAEVISSHARASTDRAARARAATDKRRRLEEDRADAERALGALRAEGEVPTEDALSRARAERDATWDALRKTPDALRTEGARFERALRAADDVADRLRREAARVTRALELESAIGAIARKLEVSREEERAIEREADEASRAWDALFRQAKMTPRSPDEMIGWRARFDAAVSAARRAADASEAARSIEATESAAREALRAALEREGIAADGESARELEQRARRAVMDRERALAERAAAEAARDEAGRERDRAARARAAYERDRAEWAGRWANAARGVGLDATASPEQVTAALEALGALRTVEEEARKLERRLAGIDRDAARFTDDVRALCAECAPDLIASPVEEACAELLRRIDRASAQRARREALEDQTKRLEAQERAAREACARAEESLRAFPEVIDASRAEALDARIAELDERVEHKIASLAGIREGAKQFDQSPAIEQAAEAQRQLARVRDLTERYVRLRLAASSVARLLERYRKENQGPVLERASALFATLTLGAFAGLEVGFGESDEPVLIAVRADERRLETHALSDGTLDQLYLALRVASLERLTDARGPLPLLLDDVLVHFDDQRAAAALAVLAGLARKMQVILFTHHDRVVELARRAISDRDGSRTASVHQLIRAVGTNP